ncbi:MAG: class I SAM-dependent methyltransferase [Pseudomonadota bacterium]
MSDSPHCLNSGSPVNLRQPPQLPEPGAEERSHEAALAALIRADIAQQGGAIPFHRFMHLALYAPGLGYYVAGQARFGIGGDFVTAPELGDVFARTLAYTVAAVLAQAGGDVLEAGAGSGALAADLLLALERLGRLPERYLILEVGPDLRARQRQRLESRVPHLLARVQWLDEPPASITGVVLGNEVLDAMPVHAFELDESGQAWERTVRWMGETFAWDRAAPTGALAERLTQLAPRLAAPYQSEVNLAAEAWIADLGGRLRTGALLLVDYGFPAAEYYHLQRSMGTLMCHYRHHAHGDPLRLVGLQDITAHVDFSAVAAAGERAGLTLLGYASQAQFLLDAGLREVLMASSSPDSAVQMALANQVKRLTLPSEMGELFKVLALGRGLLGPLPGFGGRGRACGL